MVAVSDQRAAAAAFCRDADTCLIEPLGTGNINDTFLVQGKAGAFVLQKINSSVFPQPLRVINNFQKITSHLIKKQCEHEQIFYTAQPVLTLEGALAWLDYKGEYWRGQTYLAGATRQAFSGPDQVRRAGRTLAIFHLLAADLDVASLEDPLPGFHNLSRYMTEFDRILPTSRRAIDQESRFCLEMIERCRSRSTALLDARQAGILTVQPIHGDPKIDNFIFSDGTAADGMLDFDTVGSGLVHYDLGDCLRSTCNKAGESGASSVPASFDLEYCRLFLQGYFSPDRDILQDEQQGYIFASIHLITFELGLRFFTDFLRGNTYFKVQKESDNLMRAVRQFQLAEDIAGKEKEIQHLVMAASRAA